jgi:uncharacterized protein YceH (UPF0502 family)
MLSVIEGRVLGCLLEKQRTTPDQYPLTLNALVTACNQNSSRDPVMRLDEHEVSAALHSLKAAGILRFVHPSHGRSVIRYRQVADESWGLEPEASAVLAILLLRGPQTTAELRSRTERLHEFESLDAVQAALTQLATQARAELVDRQPGQKEARWRQLVADETEVISGMSVVDGSAVSGSVADRLALLEARIARIEAAIGDLPDSNEPDHTGQAADSE